MLADTLRRPGTVLLDAPRPDADTGRRGALLFSDPERILCADDYSEVEGVLDALDAALASGRHVAGFLAYEAGYVFEPRLLRDSRPPGQETPLAWFGVYDAPQRIDDRAVAEALAAVEPGRVRAPRLAITPDAYRRAVITIKEHIEAGDVYQVNLTAPFWFDVDGEPLALFAVLRGRQRAAYGALVQAEEVTVASVSPELFFRIDREGATRTITARPMKGTAPRAETAMADDALVAALRASPKDRAENLMIVDLLRNDVARVAETGSVQVPALFEAERYETVTQMTSTVAATLRQEVSLGDVMRALFPCGSVTGAPKLRAMELIRDVEVGPRGVYCGAVGYAAPEGTAAFNVAIRTAVIASQKARYDVGSGIVWDSEPDAEYAECLLKARVLTGDT